MGIFGFAPMVVVVGAGSGIASFKDMLEQARAAPGKLSFASGGLGSLPHLVGELVNLKAGVKISHVPYNGTAPLLQAQLSQQVDCSINVLPTVEPHIRNGALRLLAVAMPQRMPEFPDVPTFRELGHDVVAESAYGIAAPRGTPPAIVNILHDAFKAAVHDPQHLAVLARFDMPVRYLDTAGFTADAAVQAEEAKRIVQELGLRAE